MEDFTFDFIDEDGYFFFAPERLICGSLENLNALLQATKEIEEIDSNGSVEL